MSTTRKHLALGAVLAGLLGMPLVLRAFPEEGGGALAAPPPSSRDPGELERELASLRAQLQEMGRAQDRLTRQLESLQGARAAAPAVATAPAGTPEAPAARPVSDQDQLEAMQHQLDAKAAAEGRDPRWAVETEGQIARAFRTDAYRGSTPGLMECFSTMCRVEVVHDGPEARERFLDAFLAAPPLTGPSYLQQVPGREGRPATVMYMARPGSSFPRLGQP